MTLVELTLFGIPLILISSAMLGFFTAYGVGANDVANAMGTSVGSKAITLKPVSYTHLTLPTSSVV